jgi:hypothetical protein
VRDEEYANRGKGCGTVGEEREEEKRRRRRGRVFIGGGKWVGESGLLGGREDTRGRSEEEGAWVVVVGRGNNDPSP